MTAAVRIWWTLALSSLPRGATEEETGIESTYRSYATSLLRYLLVGSGGRYELYSNYPLEIQAVAASIVAAG